MHHQGMLLSYIAFTDVLCLQRMCELRLRRMRQSTFSLSKWGISEYWCAWLLFVGL